MPAVRKGRHPDVRGEVPFGLKFERPLEEGLGPCQVGGVGVRTHRLKIEEGERRMIRRIVAPILDDSLQ